LIFTGTTGGIFRSANTGTTWERIGAGDGVYGVIDTVIFDPNNLTTLYAAAFSQKVYQSTDSGDSWVEKANGLPSNVITSLIINPNNSNILYLSTLAGVYKTSNSGDEWIVKNTGLTNTTVYGIALDEDDPAIVYAATSEGVFISRNGADSWSATGLTISATSIAVHPQFTSLVYAGGRRSFDQGDNWSLAALTNTGLSFAIDKNLSSVIYSGGFAGISRSMDGGNTAAELSTGLEYTEIRSIDIDPNNSNVVYAASIGGGVYQIEQTDLAPSPFLVSLAITPASTTTNQGDTQQFNATGTLIDNTTQDLTGQVTWASSNTAVATISATGLASGVAAGTTEITASVSALQASAAITVTEAANTPDSSTGDSGGGGGGSLYYLILVLLSALISRKATPQRMLCGD
jgi:hypothetical protein